MFSADLISPEDFYRLALRDPTIVVFDFSGFKFIYVKPIEFKLAVAHINKVRSLNFLYAWQISLTRHKLPFEIRDKISRYLDNEDHRPLKILNKF